jgi:endonuclease YncB( thermonuclease family)
VLIKKVSCLAIALLLFSSLCFSAPTKTYGNVTVSRVVSVYDGDTIMVDIDQCPPIIGQGISVRIYGIDTPEIKSKNPQGAAIAKQARDYVQDLLKTAKVIELRNMQKDKYFRILAEVYADGQSIADLLRQKGYAVPYDGGTKQDWGKLLR